MKTAKRHKTWAYSVFHGIRTAVRTIYSICIDALLPQGAGLRSDRLDYISEIRRLNQERIFGREACALDSRGSSGSPALPIFFFKYRDPAIKRCVWDFKYYLNRDAIELMADIYYDEIVARLISTVSDLPLRQPAHIIYVPSSSYASGKRRWDQMYELSTEVFQRMNACFPFALVSQDAIRFSKRANVEIPQHKHTRLERISDAASKYVLDGKFARLALDAQPAARVFCFDDVTTTGASLHAVWGVVYESLGVRTELVSFCH